LNFIKFETFLLQAHRGRKDRNRAMRKISIAPSNVIKNVGGRSTRPPNHRQEGRSPHQARSFRRIKHLKSAHADVSKECITETPSVKSPANLYREDRIIPLQAVAHPVEIHPGYPVSLPPPAQQATPYNGVFSIRYVPLLVPAWSFFRRLSGMYKLTSGHMDCKKKDAGGVFDLTVTG
jgi:hypothetical protein